MRISNRKKYFVLLIVSILFLSSCSIFFARIIVSRGLASTVLRASRVGGTVALRGAASTAILSRATSFSLMPRISRGLNVNRSINIVSKSNQILATARLAKNTTRLYLPNNTTIPIIRSVRKGNITSHYDFTGHKIGYSRYSKNLKRIDYYSLKNKKLGYDLIFKKEIKHYDDLGNFLYKSRAVVRPNVSTYKALRYTKDVLELYSRHIVYNNKEVNSVYTRYLYLLNKCYDDSLPRKTQKEACFDKTLLQGEIGALLKKYQ